MPYGEIVERSFSIWRRHRYLWLLGLLSLVGTFTFTPPFWFPGGHQAAAPGGYTGWINEHLALIVAANLALLLLALLLFAVSCAASPALVEAAAWHDGDRDFDFHRAWRAGRLFFWRVLALRSLVLAVVLAMVIVIGVFVLLTVLAFVGNVAVLGVILLVIDFVLVVAAFATLLALQMVTELALRVLVLSRRRVRPAIREAVQLFRRRLGRVLLVWLLMIALGYAAGIPYAIVFFVVLGSFVGLGFAVASQGAAAITAVVVSGVVVFLVLTFGFSGLYNSFTSIYWTVAFRRLDRESLPVSPPSAYPAAYPRV